MKLTMGFLTFTAAVLSGCAVEEGATEEDIATVEQGLDNSSPATEFYWRRAAFFPRGSDSCAGTIIGSRAVLTAAHCNIQVGDDVHFFTSSHYSYTETREVIAVRYPSGVSATDETDTNGKYGDMVVLRLDAAIPTTSVVAQMAWTYPYGGDDFGILTGAGQHDATHSPGSLFMAGDLTYSSKDSDGHFLLEQRQTETADDGGAFFYSDRLLGVLADRVWEWANRDKAVSAPFRLSWILQNMPYSWSGQAESSGVARSGPVLQTTSFFTSDKRICQYACDTTPSCRAYNYRSTNSPPRCDLLAQVNPGTTASPGTFTALK